MRNQLSSLEYNNHFLYGIAGIISGFVIIVFVGRWAISEIKENITFSVTLILICLVIMYLIFRIIVIYMHLVDFTITDKSFIIERFSKKQELPFSIIRETKHSKIPITFGEPFIKVIFKARTDFGNHIYFVPTRLDKEKHFHLDSNIKSVLDKIIN